MKGVPEQTRRSEAATDAENAAYTLTHNTYMHETIGKKPREHKWPDCYIPQMKHALAAAATLTNSLAVSAWQPVDLERGSSVVSPLQSIPAEPSS
jgi:hypothetical protein